MDASSQEALVMLEPYTGKLVRTVLREERGREAPDLPGYATRHSLSVSVYGKVENLYLYEEVIVYFEYKR